MQLIPIKIESVRLGRPLPFAILDKHGVLLARKDFILESRKDLETMALRGAGLYIHVEDSELHRRAFVDTLYGLLREEKPLGEIAETRVNANQRKDTIVKDIAQVDWLDLQEQCNLLLRDCNPTNFVERLDKLQNQLAYHTLRNPDGTLFALIYLSATQTRMYSATHAMLVSVMCSLACREVLQWSAEAETILCRAALSMNLAMTNLQDRLAMQIGPLNPYQRKEIDDHAQASAELLQSLGITDEMCLETVRDHHNQLPGPLSSKPPAQRLARLLQRADMFAARLSPRASRTPISPAAAMQACYFDENRQVDEAGAALIKAVGIHHPGSYVKLATEEIAVVIKRGTNTTTPRVAVVINRSGLPTVEPIVRDTSQRDYRITASVPHRDVKVQINLERILPLTASPNNDRPW
jgi:HD-GYP domain-containing protein (c-di-GMP phosphodiesterase class II)